LHALPISLMHVTSTDIILLHSIILIILGKEPKFLSSSISNSFYPPVTFSKTTVLHIVTCCLECRII
jgi:hypothetical protein